MFLFIKRHAGGGLKCRKSPCAIPGLSPEVNRRFPSISEIKDFRRSSKMGSIFEMLKNTHRTFVRGVFDRRIGDTVACHRRQTTMSNNKSKREEVHDEPIFLLTNAENFPAKFIVQLYLKRFCIELFFKDAKQFLNFETFLCRKECKLDLYLLLNNVLRWAVQGKNSISKTVMAIRENIADCLLFINENQLIGKFFEELKKIFQI